MGERAWHAGAGLWGRALVDTIQNYNQYAGIGINGDCLPQDGNYLELSEEVDAHGLPKPRVHFSYGPRERAISAHAVTLMTALWQEAGATDIWSLPRAAHTIGTCRMGTAGDRSVVDPSGRSFEHRQSMDLRQFDIPQRARRQPGIDDHWR